MKRISNLRSKKPKRLGFETTTNRAGLLRENLRTVRSLVGASFKLIADSVRLTIPVSGPTRDNLRADLIITLICVAFWLGYAWQHGYSNSPDSYYRGILAKSILEGHPYWINLKQGWLYEYSTWHHSNAHPPLLPFLYAIFFLLSNIGISATNIVVSLAAGLTAFPLLRLSRGLTGTPLAGLLTYCWVVFNPHDDFLFEVFYGLSIPVTLANLAFALYACWLVLVRSERRYVVVGAFALACYFYIRPGEQLLFFGLMLCSISLGWFYLRRPAYLRQAAMWGGATLLILPWLARSMVLFGSPIFTHMSPLLWTDQGSDYWNYHELMPLPTAASYFARHSFADLLWKIFAGAKDYFGVLNEAMEGSILAYALSLLAACVAIFGIRNRLKRYFLILVVLLFLGYSLLHSLVPLIDRRYMIMPLACVYMIAVYAVLIPGNRLWVARWISLVIAAGLFGVVQWNFWMKELPKTLTFSFSNSDQQMRHDPTIEALKQRLGPNDIVLGPIAEVQRLNFATGVGFVEAPQNLAHLRDPPAFFRRYRIRYSLVDVSRILPEAMIQKLEVVGDRPLFHIRLEESSSKGSGEAARLADSKVSGRSRNVASGIRNRLVYVDIFHGTPIANEEWLKRLGNLVTSSAGDLVVNQEKLLRSGLFVMRYAQKKPEIDERNFALIEQFIGQGGRVLLLCPAWVAVAYERRSLQEIGCNRIAHKFSALITADAVGPPFKLEIGFIGRGGTMNLSSSPAFSRIITPRAGEPIMTDAQGNPIVAAVRVGGSRLVIWGHDNMFDASIQSDAEGRQMVERIFAWLWATD